MRRLSVILASIVVVLTGCGGSTASSPGAATRTVQVDHKHDEFASAFLSYFPKNVTVRPGDTVRFRQTWTGEPHSVTMGTLVDEFFRVGVPAIMKYPSEADAPPDLVKEVNGMIEKLPFMMGEEGVQQNGAQPCYLDSGEPPKDPETPCEKRAQPAFNGKQTYYNSGFIPYQGSKGNTFEVKLADDIAPGTYNYYCNLHFIEMSGTIEVKAKGAEIPSQSDVSKQGRREIEVASTKIRAALEEARAGKAEFKPPLAGFGIEENVSPVLVNEFIPSTINAKVGEPVTWTMVGGHTISFNVPKYFPLFTVAKNGTVSRERRAYEPVKWPTRAPVDYDALEREGKKPEPATVDAGKFDGTGGLHSSGSDWLPGDKFVVTFTKPGTYTYACIIHPPMVGKVVVK